MGQAGAATDLCMTCRGDRPQENQILLAKLIKIKTFDSTRVFRPWLARSTFQYGNGTYIDPATGELGLLGASPSSLKAGGLRTAVTTLVGPFGCFCAAEVRGRALVRRRAGACGWLHQKRLGGLALAQPCPPVRAAV